MRAKIINNLTFNYGGLTETIDPITEQKTYIYILALDADFFKEVKAFAVGTDQYNGYNYTNVNTLIVGSDCEKLLTSYPGFPRRPPKPNYYGTPNWWKPTWVLPL